MIFPPLGGFFMGETLSCDTGGLKQQKSLISTNVSIQRQSIWV